MPKALACRQGMRQVYAAVRKRITEVSAVVMHHGWSIPVKVAAKLFRPDRYLAVIDILPDIARATLVTAASRGKFCKCRCGSIRRIIELTVVVPPLRA